MNPSWEIILAPYRLFNTDIMVLKVLICFFTVLHACLVALIQALSPCVCVCGNRSAGSDDCRVNLIRCIYRLAFLALPCDRLAAGGLVLWAKGIWGGRHLAEGSGRAHVPGRHPPLGPCMACGVIQTARRMYPPQTRLFRRSLLGNSKQVRGTPWFKKLRMSCVPWLEHDWIMHLDSNINIAVQ